MTKEQKEQLIHSVVVDDKEIDCSSDEPKYAERKQRVLELFRRYGEYSYSENCCKLASVGLGAYYVIYVTKDGELLCGDCADAELREALDEDYIETDPIVAAFSESDFDDDGNDEFCANCSKTLFKCENTTNFEEFRDKIRQGVLRVFDEVATELDFSTPLKALTQDDLPELFEDLALSIQIVWDREQEERQAKEAAEKENQN